MNLRRVIAAGMLVLGTSGVGLSIAAVERTWSIRDSLAGKVSSVFEALIPAVERIGELLGRAVDRLREVQRTLRELEQAAERIRDKKPDIDPETKARLRELAGKVVAGLDEAQTRLAGLRETISAVEKLVEAAKVVAPGRFGKLNTEPLREANTLLADFASGAGELSSWLRDILADRIKDWAVGKLARRLEIGVAEVAAKVSTLRDDTGALSSDLPRAREQALDRLHTAAILVTVLLVWICLAQGALAALGVRWWRRESQRFP